MFKKIILFLFCSSLGANSLIEDLETAGYWDRKMDARLPITYNHHLSVGYFMTHSARMARMGEFGVGASHFLQDDSLNFHLQPFAHFELSFHKLKKKNSGANLKVSLALPEDSCNVWPGIALGADDINKKDKNYYVVGTQVFINQGLELSLGGSKKGFFGGAEWFPFFSCEERWKKGIALALEYDPKTHFSGGFKYNFCDQINFSASYMGGKDFAIAGSFHCQWGTSNGFLPKLKDPPFYKLPLGCSPPETLLIEKFSSAFNAQGFLLTKSWLGGNQLTLQVINCRYRCEGVVRRRLQYLLSSLLPSYIDSVIVILESYGMPVQQYVYSQGLLRNSMGPCEFDLLTPRCEVTCPRGEMIYCHRPELWRFRPSPLFEIFPGKKFKYDFGVRAGLEGFLPGNIFYEVMASYPFVRTSKTCPTCDSTLPIVLTDYVNYRKRRILAAERIYLQKNLNFGKGCFGSLSAGYFQINYAGIGGEFLWYPARSYFAVGLEGALLRKRRYSGFGFQSKLRKCDGSQQPYITLQQYFFNLFVDVPEWQMCARASLGGFLARDKGARFELTRYFPSGVRLTGWVTVTNAHEKNNRGIALEIPLDLFFQCSSRRVWNYGMAAWLQDAGAFIPVGRSLFDVINRERRL